MRAVAYGQEEICNLLLNRGANVDTCNRHGTTALHCAVWRGSIQIVKRLLSAGARFDYYSLNHARIASQREIVSLLRNHMITETLSGVISRGLITNTDFSQFLIEGISDCRLFLIVAKFAYN